MTKVFDYSSTSSLDNFFPKNLPTSVKRAMAKKLLLVFDRYLMKSCQSVAMAGAVMEKIKPRLVITTHDPAPSALPFVYFARTHSVPSLVLQHGLHYSVFGTKYESDHIGIWGKKMKQWYQYQYKKKIHNIHCLGFPVLDKLYLNHSQAMKHFHEPELTHPISIGVLLAYYFPTFGESKFLHELFEACLPNQSRLRLSIRGHPGQHLDDAEALAKFFRVSAQINQEMPIDEFVNSHDVIVTWDTTAMLWAMIRRKPLFYAPPWWGVGQIPVQDYKCAWIPSSAHDLINEIMQLPSRPDKINTLRENQRRFLTDFVGILDGQSTERHIRLIQNLLIKKRFT